MMYCICLKMYLRSYKTDLDSQDDSNIMHSGLTQDFKAVKQCKRFHNETVKI